MSNKIVAAIFLALLLIFVGIMVWNPANRVSPPPPVARADLAGMWHEDLEADVCAGNNIYAATVEQLAALTRGKLKITEVVERWGGERGPITVEFVESGVRHRFSPPYDDDWLVLEDVLAALNKILEPRGMRLEERPTNDQTAKVVAVNLDGGT